MSGRSVEDAIQIELVRVARNDYGLFVYHVPNGGKRSEREGAQFKRMGVTPGIPDLVFVLPKGKHVYVELKTKSGTVRDSQKAVMQTLDKYGNECFVVKGLKHGLKVLEYIAEIARGNPHTDDFNERESKR